MDETTNDNSRLNISADDQVTLDDGLQVGLHGKTESGNQKIVVRRVNWPRSKQSDEIEVTRRFCLMTDNGLSKFEPVEEYSDIDVHATSEEGTQQEDFQVRVLFDEEFWQNLNTTGGVDVELSVEELCDLVVLAVTAKNKKYPKAQKPKIILLVDLSPATIDRELLQQIKMLVAPKLGEVNFKAIWLVGSRKEELLQLL